MRAHAVMLQRRDVVAILLSCLAAWLTGCAVELTGGLHIWAVDDSVRIMPEAGAPIDSRVYDESSGVVSIAAAINEVVAFQLVLRSKGGAVGDVRVTVDDLASDEGIIGSATAVAVFREHVTPVSRYPAWFLRHGDGLRAPREYPDALIPLSAPRYGQPVTVAPGRNVPIWVDVRIPHGTAPGIYRSTIRIAAGITEHEVPLELTVWPIALPDLPGLEAIAVVDHEKLFAHHLVLEGRPYAPRRLAPEEPRSTEAQALLTETFRLLRAHRLSPCLKRFYPVVKITGEDAVEVDWDDYDGAVTDFLDGTAFEDRVPVSAWPLPIDRDVPTRAAFRPGGQSFSGRHATHVASYLQQCVAHFREKGWYDRHFIWYAPPEPSRSRDAADAVAIPSDAIERFARLIHTAEPGARFLAAYPPQDMRTYGWHGLKHSDTDEFVSIFCPSARWYDPEAMEQQRQQGRRVWFIPDEPPHSGSLALEAGVLQPRTLPWAAERLGADGFLLCKVNDWPEAPAAVLDMAIDTDDQPSDAWLIYPGRDAGLSQPLPSIRLKQLRRGMQDYAYVQLLHARGHDDVANRVAAALLKRAGTLTYGDHFLDTDTVGWVRNPMMWSLGRRLMAEVLAETRDPGNETAALNTHVNWVRFRSETQTVRTNPQGVRVRARADGRLEAVVHVEVTNDREQSVSGMLSFDDLPLGWKSTVERWAVSELAPGERRRVALSAEADTLPSNAYGVVELKVRFSEEGRPALDVSVRLAHVAVQHVDTPLRIDGDLSDWPPGLGNVAGDFLLVRPVGDAEASETTQSRPRASQQTTAFVCRDDERLYFSMRCAEADAGGAATTTTNHVHYDRTTPVGEDLVEVVIDPTNGSTGDTGDLYHIIIKPNGVALAERGIGWHPPTGARRIWAADVKVATTPVRNGHWCVEASVPLSAFGPDSAASGRGRFWAVEFARFQHRLGERSSWSGARRHVYSPRRLGNMSW